MKKIITKILSLVLALTMSIGFFSGCDLITTDAELDMQQTIATVQLEGMKKDEIKKAELVSAFNTSGYLYVLYYGYTESDTYDMLFEELVKNRIVVQQAKQALTTATTTLQNPKGYFLAAKEAEEKTSIDNYLTIPNYDGKDMTTIDKNADVVNFLTEYEVLKSKYNALKNIESIINDYKDIEEEEHNHNHDSITPNIRTTLTVETEVEGNEWEIKNDKELSVITEEYKKSFKKDLKALELNVEDYQTKYDLSYNVYKKYIETFDVTDKESKKALNKAIKDLKKFGFISSEEASRATPKTVEELFNISYFKNSLITEYEILVVDKLETALQNQEEKKINSDEKLYQEYKSLYETQKASFDKSYEAYETALENANDSTFVVYNPNLGGKYGYIANLLIGFNTEQTTALEGFTEKVIGEKVAYRETLLESLVAKDQRHTWALSNYGTFNPETGEFVFDEDYCKTLELRKYQGTLLGASSYVEHDSYDEEITKYNFKAVEGAEIAFNDFYNDVVSKIMGFTGREGKLEGVEESTIISTTLCDDAMIKFRDLIYAYSTDPGSLSETYGYVYSPISSKTKYVKEFADGAKRVIDKGVGAYEVVATDFGYHIMLCTSVITPGNELASMENFLKDVQKEGTLAYKFKEYKYNLISSKTITQITNTIVNTNKEKDNVVTYFKSTYDDLITEEE